MQINNPNNDFEYSGPPKRQAIGNTIVSVMIAALFFWFSSYLYSQFIAYENGSIITMQKLLWTTYGYVGKWPIIAFFGLLGVAFLGVAYHHSKKYKAARHQNF
jgi:hypothetical protein